MLTFPGWLQDPWSGLGDLGHAAGVRSAPPGAGRLLPRLADPLS